MLIISNYLGQQMPKLNREHLYNSKYKQFYIFIIVGIILFTIDTTIFFLLSFSKLGITEINIVSKSLAAIVGYFLHQKYTFYKECNQNSLRQAIRYIAYLCLMIVISTLLLQFFNHVIVDIRTVPLVTLCVKVLVEGICVIISYLISKIWVYNT